MIILNIADVIKKQTDEVFREQKLRPNQSQTFSPSTGSSGGGSIYQDPVRDLAAHKSSGDHDGRYYTEDEVDALFAALTYPGVVRQTYDMNDSITVAHNLGVRPIVQVVGQVPTAYGAGNYGAGGYGGIDDAGNAVLSPSSITHDTVNQVTVALSAAATGEVICVG